MPYMTAEQQAERDELVAGLLLPEGISEWMLTRVLRVRLGQKPRGRGGHHALGSAALRRLEAAGRARCVEEPWPCRAGIRRVWFPAGEES